VFARKGDCGSRGGKFVQIRMGKELISPGKLSAELTGTETPCPE
jgi:hypothetical protein